MRFAYSLVFLGLVAVWTPGCHRRLPSQLTQQIAGPGAAEAATNETQPAQPNTASPTGTSCNGRDDCPSDQVCVEHLCRHRNASIAGEIFAQSAEAQVAAGDWGGAIRAYDEAITAYNGRGRGVAIPPEVLCRSAALMLRTATTPEEREKGARRAYDCFAATLPGARDREEVARSLARLRFEGLEVAAFDQATAPNRFFTGAPGRPTTDAVRVTTNLRDLDESTFRPIKAQLESDSTRRALAECFVSDWDERHQRQASGSFVLRYSTSLHDMGSYDVFEGQLEVTSAAIADDNFASCVLSALRANLHPSRASHTVAWQSEVDVHAEIQ